MGSSSSGVSGSGAPAGTVAGTSAGTTASTSAGTTASANEGIAGLSGDYGATQYRPGPASSPLPVGESERRLMLSPEGRAIAGMLFTASSAAVESKWAAYVGQLARTGGPIDVNDLVQAVLREAYLANTEDLRFFAEKVKFFNDLKKEIRDELTKARDAFAETAGQADDSDLLTPYGSSEVDGTFYGDISIKTVGDLEKYHDQIAHKLSPGGGSPALIQEFERVRAELGLYSGSTASAALQRPFEATLRSSLQPGKELTKRSELDAYIKGLEEKLNSVGDDAQLANVDLQNMLQKQQQTLQMMSNISKMLHDTAMAIIRKIGG
jgi:hypothetical protein